MSIRYRHSETMTRVKTAKESISENLSSNQYIELLDALFYRALSPIILNCSYADSIIAACMHNISLNGRRKISVVDKDHLLALMCLFISVPRERKLEVLKQMRIERTILRYIIQSWLEEMEEFEGLYTNRDPASVLRRDFIMRRLEWNKEYDLFCSIQTVKFWYQETGDYKKKINEKFLRFITMEAQHFYKINDSKMELDDIIQTLSQFASRAIDKFDTTCGTLTSYIKNWLTHAKGVSAQHELGTAFILPTSKRNQVKNTYVSIDDEEVLELENDENVLSNIERMSEINRVRYIAKCLDPNGYGRVSLGISEFLTKEEIAEQKKYEKM